MDYVKNQKLVKKRTHKKHKTNKRRRQNESSGDESVDMSEDVFPLAHYISNRDKMIEQVFAVMEKEKLKCMLPPILKGLTLSALKESCLKELKSMSDEEVRKVLCGESLEPPSDSNSVTLQLDSDSRESLSSLEECTNVEEKKQTLLDILEQEMQEIAFNTVLKKSENTECLTDSDDLSEILVITPTNSCKSQNNVPLICIDSGDEESSLPQTQRQKENSTSLCVEHDENVTNTKENLSKNHVESGLDEIVVDQTLQTNSGSSGKFAATEESGELKVSSNLNKTSMSSKESFLIKVFSSNNASSERVVHKVVKSSTDDKDTDEITVAIHKECEINKTNDDNTSTLPIKNKIEEIIIDSIEVDKTENNKSESTNSTSLNCKASNSSNKNCTVEAPEGNYEPPLTEEKEEGEISEEESDEGVQVVKEFNNKKQSKTVCLSPDSSSDAEESDSRTRERKPHRHRRTKHRTNSPERSRRRLEKRGNRSYRCKTVSEKAASPEKCQEITNQEIDLNSISLPPGDMPMKPQSQNDDCPKTPPIEEDILCKLPVVEDARKETTNVVISPNKFEDGVEDAYGSFVEPDESEAGDSVSTNTSWADRWAVKKDLKKVVITSKICRNVRKRILSARKKQTVVEPVLASAPVLPPVPPLVLHVEGSVQEYQMLQLLVNNGSDEENSKSNSMVVENTPDAVVSDPTTDSQVPMISLPGDACSSSTLEENQQEKA